jgi:hypothetical protein
VDEVCEVRVAACRAFASLLVHYKSSDKFPMFADQLKDFKEAKKYSRRQDLITVGDELI